MDAAAYLALLSKAKRVFESENTFLSFPVLSQLTYDVEDLQFSGDAPAAQRLVNLSEFSRVTNRIQRGVVAAIDGDEYLWDVYDDVLSNAELAEPALNEAQQKEYAAALELLYTETADGLRHESPVLQGYKTFRDAHIKALEEYKNRQLTADISADPAVKAQWVVDEAAIRQTIDDIEASWKAAGRKAEVEAAQQVERACNHAAPALRWDEWRASFVADLDLATDTNQIRFAATMFSPHDVFDTADWLRFTHSSDEIVALGTQAPQELREILGQADTASDIQSLSFEYRSVALDRAWLQRSVFDSRFWRLGPEGGELCDGGDPPKGRCPGYPVALVFARRVTLQWKGTPPADDQVIDPGRPLRLRPDILKRLRLSRPELTAPRPVAATVARPRLESLGRRRRSMPILTTAAKAKAPTPVEHHLSGAGFGVQEVLSPQLRVRFASPKTQLRSTQPDPAPNPVPTAESTLPASSTGDAITIRGLLCKRHVARIPTRHCAGIGPSDPSETPEPSACRSHRSVRPWPTARRDPETSTRPRASVPVQLDLGRIGRYPPSTEAAFYYCCSEALQNAAKHGDPDTTVMVTAVADEQTLTLTISDTGRGFTPTIMGMG